MASHFFFLMNKLSFSSFSINCSDYSSFWRCTPSLFIFLASTQKEEDFLHPKMLTFSMETGLG